MPCLSRVLACLVRACCRFSRVCPSRNTTEWLQAASDVDLSQLLWLYALSMLMAIAGFVYQVLLRKYRCRFQRYYYCRKLRNAMHVFCRTRTSCVHVKAERVLSDRKIVFSSFLLCARYVPLVRERMNASNLQLSHGGIQT